MILKRRYAQTDLVTYRFRRWECIINDLWVDVSIWEMDYFLLKQPDCVPWLQVQATPKMIIHWKRNCDIVSNT